MEDREHHELEAEMDASTDDHGGTGAEEGAPPLPSLPVRIGQLFFSPGKLFEALREKPAWFGILLLGGVLAGLSVFLIPEDIFMEGMREQMIQQGREVPPAFESTGGIVRLFSLLGGGLSLFIWAFLLAGIATLVFTFLMGGEGRYKQYLAVVSHGLFISAVGSLLLAPLRIAQADPMLTLNLGTFAFFLEEGYPFRVLRLLELFGLWGYTIMAIGVTKVDPKRSLGGALTFFYGFAVVFALIFGIFGGPG